jgi:hypothetical protein
MTTTTQDLNMPVEKVDVSDKKKGGSKGTRGSTTRGGGRGK